MSRIKTRVERRKARRRLEEIPAKAQRRIGQAVREAAIEVQNEVTRIMRETKKSGRTYRRGHIASAPGEPPAPDTARLLRSIKVRSRGLQADVYTGLEYAPWLEFGTGRILPRPFMRPAAKNKKKKVVEMVRRSVREATKG